MRQVLKSFAGLVRPLDLYGQDGFGAVSPALNHLPCGPKHIGFRHLVCLS
jgi:hypothetical protein